MIAIYGIAAALGVLVFWAGILWIAARADRKHLEREHAERVFGDEKNNG
ncbi:MAG: hypothetical protein RSE14_03250 [Erythrobacter sp.]|nr:hypothetical protein [Erythrobacter sp.]WRH71126.1 MAG: hypothetical protein RSE14_03250 [Erythrobacter sp.]